MPLFDTATLLAYTAAAVVLVLLPGPGTAWILAQSFAGGTKRGIQAGLGLETATLLHALAAGLGLSALLATSAMAFEFVKYLGAAYLVWLGIKAWRNGDAGATPADADAPKPRASGRSVYLRSVVTGVLNPKVALFFLAFLPQFVHPERGWVWLQFFVLGALLALIGFCNDLFLSFAAGRFGRRFAGGNGRWMQRVTGTLFIGLGLRLAMQQRG
ncbi:LysE family translocator [Lysobacter auxotrophicus]|uniref:LysE family translocator n=1 Tax=Lysobacter auxotrophicus TaxID=2992573 RepID=A0ABM8DGC0_9GAMM|nr:LysE family translocator [Lysobacter auxotrophicus]BDU17636.1 LysE family translocator [Lysobacter auxotrophicus]